MQKYLLYEFIGILSLFLVLSLFAVKNEVLTHEFTKINYIVGKCSSIPITRSSFENLAFYDNKTKILTISVIVNCCSDNITVEWKNNTYVIRELDFDKMICRCICEREIKIFNAKLVNYVLFYDLNGKLKKIKVEVMKEERGEKFCGISTYGECKTDKDCIISGCSGQVCQSRFEKPLFTTCEWRECYDYRKYGYACKCVNGKCQWVKII